MSVNDAFYIFRGERVYSYKRTHVDISLYHGKINRSFFVNRKTNWGHCVVFWMPQEEWGLHIWGWTYLLWKRWNNRWPACGFLPRPGETKTLVFVVVVVGCNLVVCNAAVLGKSMVNGLANGCILLCNRAAKRGEKRCCAFYHPCIVKIRFLTIAWIPTSDRIKLQGRKTCYKTSWPWAGKNVRATVNHLFTSPSQISPRFFQGKNVNTSPLSFKRPSPPTYHSSLANVGL